MRFGRDSCSRSNRKVLVVLGEKEKQALGFFFSLPSCCNDGRQN